MCRATSDSKTSTLRAISSVIGKFQSCYLNPAFALADNDQVRRWLGQTLADRKEPFGCSGNVVGCFQSSSLGFTVNVHRIDDDLSIDQQQVQAAEVTAIRCPETQAATQVHFSTGKIERHGILRQNAQPQHVMTGAIKVRRSASSVFLASLFRASNWAA